jgi:hypothetical protein
MLLVAAAVAGSACSVPSSPPTPGTSQAAGTPGPEELTEDQAIGLRRALAAESLGEADGLPSEAAVDEALPDVQVLKAVRLGGTAFALATLGGKTEGAVFASLGLRVSGWRVEGVAPVSVAPPRDSNGFLLQTLSVGGLVAHGGFVDPTASAVDTLDPFGDLVDADEPFAGAVLVTSRRFGLLRVLRGHRTIGALQIVVTSSDELALLQPTRIEEALRRDARQVADRFVDTFLTDGWVEATAYYNPDGRPDLLLPPLATVVRPGVWRREGQPDAQRKGFIYPIRGPQGRAFLHVEVALHLGEWKVTGCALSTPPEGGAVPIG